MPRLLVAFVLFAPIVLGQTLLRDDVVSFRIQLGVSDTAERDWSGKVTVPVGDLAGLRVWRPHEGSQAKADGTFALASYKGMNFTWRPWETPPPAGKVPYTRNPGLVVDVGAEAGSRVVVSTEQGRFAFRVDEIPYGTAKTFLDGSVLVDRVPPAERVSADTHQSDYATIMAGPDGQTITAWIGYRDGANEVLARRFDGTSWGDVRTISPSPGDYFLVKAAQNAQGMPCFAYSAQRNGNFDLFGRCFADGQLSPEAQITTHPGHDIFHNVAANSDGKTWIVWQSWRDGQSDIYAVYYDGDQRSQEMKVSTSPKNDWEPVIAIGNSGQVHVAWDSYDQGNYDVMLRTWSDGTWSDVQPIASTEKYEAHVSLAVDQQDRLWATWNESGMNWGKDTGYTLNLEGTRLYEWRSIAVAVHDGAKWLEPGEDFNAALPAEIAHHNDFPQLSMDPDGRMWVYFRHRTLRQRDLHSETPAHRASWEIWGSTLDGASWTEPVHFAHTRGRQDLRWGIATSTDGTQYAAWPTDNRDYREFLYRTAEVYTARLPKLGGAPAAPQLVTRPTEELPFFPVGSPNEEADVTRIRDYAVEHGAETYHIYRGDTHRHTEFSMDGNNDGPLFVTYRYAIDAADLDYMLVSEHNFQGGPDNEYINWVLQQAVDLHSINGVFQPFYGYERSISYPDGHRNILFAERGNPALAILPEESRHEKGAARLYAYLKERGGIAISHTSASGMGTDWRDNDPEVEPLVEIYQGDRVSAEYLGAPRAANAMNRKSAPGNFRPAGYVWNAWAKGYKLGIQAASDHLSTHISYAMTIAEDHSRESMLDAMRARHNYGATDNIVLDYRLKVDGSEYLQGDIVPGKVTGQPTIKINIVGTSDIRQVDIIRGQQFIHTAHRLPQTTMIEFTDNEPVDGETYYYVRVLQHDGEIAWSSPVWTTR